MDRYAIRFKPSGESALAKSPELAQKRMVEAVEDLAENPRPPGCVKLANEEDLWRDRVGNCRLVYTIHDEELLVLVVRVAHRKDVYQEN